MKNNRDYSKAKCFGPLCGCVQKESKNPFIIKLKKFWRRISTKKTGSTKVGTLSYIFVQDRWFVQIVKDWIRSPKHKCSKLPAAELTHEYEPKFDTFTFPIINRIYPELFSLNLVSVQPMTNSEDKDDTKKPI